MLPSGLARGGCGRDGSAVRGGDDLTMGCGRLDARDEGRVRSELVAAKI